MFRILVTIAAFSIGVTSVYAAMYLLAALSAAAQTNEDYASWPVLKSTFLAESGDGTMIKGYDPSYRR